MALIFRHGTIKYIDWKSPTISGCLCNNVSAIMSLRPRFSERISLEHSWKLMAVGQLLSHRHFGKYIRRTYHFPEPRMSCHCPFAVTRYCHVGYRPPSTEPITIVFSSINAISGFGLTQHQPIPMESGWLLASFRQKISTPSAAFPSIDRFLTRFLPSVFALTGNIPRQNLGVNLGPDWSNR